MPGKKRKLNVLMLSTFFIMATLVSGCVNHLEKGWDHFGKGEYRKAQSEWVQNEKPKLPEEISKADAAIALVDLNRKITAAKADQDHLSVIKIAGAAVALDKWENKDWLQKSPILRTYLDNAYQSIEEAYYTILKNNNDQKRWQDTKAVYPDYQAFCSTYAKDINPRISALYDTAVLELKKEADEKARQAAEKARQDKIKASFNQQVVLGKQEFLDENFDQTMNYVRRAETIVKENPDVRLDTENLEYLKLATLQGIKIKQAMEAERQRLAEKERQAELERQRIEAEKIKLAKAAEKARLIKEEKNRRWRAFLKKGAPLKPLITTVYQPSTGTGKLNRKKRQKWQGGSQLPRPKDKSIAAEDVYALEVEVPKTHKLTYLRNYYKKRTKSRLSAPVTQRDKRSYYTENFKGGRYYLEVRNEKSRRPEYEIKTRIYKIPVTH